jgi:hypothetical protein
MRPLIPFAEKWLPFLIYCQLEKGFYPDIQETKTGGW